MEVDSIGICIRCGGSVVLLAMLSEKMRTKQLGLIKPEFLPAEDLRIAGGFGEAVLELASGRDLSM